MLKLLAGYRIGLLAALGVLATVSTGRTADFHVETKILAADGSQVAALQTIFRQRMIYDILVQSGHEATIVDLQTGQSTLLDATYRVQCRVPHQELMQLTAAIQTRAENANHPFLQFLAHPTFHETFDQDSFRLTLSGERLTYSAIGQRPAEPEAVDQYRAFADLSARLNATRSALPPAARIRLNEALAQRHLVPHQIWRRIPGQETFQAQHVFRWTVDKQDLQRIEMIQQWSRDFQEVSFEQFRRQQNQGLAQKPPR